MNLPKAGKWCQHLTILTRPLITRSGGHICRCILFRPCKGLGKACVCWVLAASSTSLAGFWWSLWGAVCPSPGLQDMPHSLLTYAARVGELLPFFPHRCRGPAPLPQSPSAQALACGGLGDLGSSAQASWNLLAAKRFGLEPVHYCLLFCWPFFFSRRELQAKEKVWILALFGYGNFQGKSQNFIFIFTPLVLWAPERPPKFQVFPRTAEHLGIPAWASKKQHWEHQVARPANGIIGLCSFTVLCHATELFLRFKYKVSFSTER